MLRGTLLVHLCRCQFQAGFHSQLQYTLLHPPGSLCPHLPLDPQTGGVASPSSWVWAPPPLPPLAPRPSVFSAPLPSPPPHCPHKLQSSAAPKGACPSVLHPHASFRGSAPLKGRAHPSFIPSPPAYSIIYCQQFSPVSKATHGRVIDPGFIRVRGGQQSRRRLP